MTNPSISPISPSFRSTRCLDHRGYDNCSPHTFRFLRSRSRSMNEVAAPRAMRNWKMQARSFPTTTRDERRRRRRRMRGGRGGVTTEHSDGHSSSNQIQLLSYNTLVEAMFTRSYLLYCLRMATIALQSTSPCAARACRRENRADKLCLLSLGT